jgi:hypothetical protein
MMDTEFVKSLLLWATNDGEVYERCAKPCIAAIKRKIKRGNYDESLVPKMFELGFLDMARRNFAKNNGVQKNRRMTSEEKKMFGNLALQYYREEIMNGTTDGIVINYSRLKSA